MRVLLRSLLVCALACSLAALAAGARVGDADDVALAEIGVDLSHYTAGGAAAAVDSQAAAGAQSASDSPSTYTEAAESYVTVRPAGHRDATVAKFPLLHEIAGESAKDWSDIQSLLFREPAVAAESNVDMKLDELEKKFNEIDAMPVPSPIPPPGATLLPGIKEEQPSLKKAMPESMMRLKQLKAKMEAKAAKKAKMEAKAMAAAMAQAGVAPAAAAAAAPAAAAAAAPAAVTVAAAPAIVISTNTTGNSTAAIAVAAAPAAAAAAAAAPAASAAAQVAATQSTLTLIEKRIAGLTTLLQRLKSQMGFAASDKQASVDRLNAALAKHRADTADLKKRMEARSMRFAQRDLDAEHDHALVDTAAEAHTEADVDADADVDAELDAEHEGAADADAEINADAQAIDDILKEIM